MVHDEAGGASKKEKYRWGLIVINEHMIATIAKLDEKEKPVYLEKIPCPWYSVLKNFRRSKKIEKHLENIMKTAETSFTSGQTKKLNIDGKNNYDSYKFL